MRPLRSLLGNHHINWALADQALVSGSNFITGVLLARLLGPELFGAFVIAITVQLYLNSFQGALILMPMMSDGPRLGPEARQAYLAGVLVLQACLSMVLAVAALGSAWIARNVLGYWQSVEHFASIALALAVNIICFQLQDWLRRYYFVLENARAVFINDLISYGGQLALLLLAHELGLLDVPAAIAIIAATSALAFVVGAANQRLSPGVARAVAILRESWRTRRDYLLAWQLHWLGGSGMLLVGSGFLGSQAAGGMRATQNLVGPINALYQVMENVVPVAAAKRYACSGVAALKAYLWRIAALGSVALVPVLLLVGHYSEPITRWLYGEAYLPYAHLVAWQAFNILIVFYQRQVIYFLRTIEASALVMRTSLVMAVVSIGVALFSIAEYRELGMIVAVVLGNASTLAYLLIAVRRLELPAARVPVTN